MEAFVYLLIFSFLLDPMLHGLGDAVFCVLIFCLIYTYRKGQTSQICSWIIYTVLCFWAFPGSDDINSAAVICGHSDVYVVIFHFGFYLHVPDAQCYFIHKGAPSI